MTLVFPIAFAPAVTPRLPISRFFAAAWGLLSGGHAAAKISEPASVEVVNSCSPVDRYEHQLSSTVESPTILVVDDEVVVRDVAVKMLQRNGYRALVAKDGAEALRVFEDRKAEISAVLMDLVMPVMGGEEAFRAIRQIDAKVPVIFSSGYSAKVVRARCGLMRPDGFLQKPYHDAQLMEVLRQAF